jgi:CheY-like chemotaxis protein
MNAGAAMPQGGTLTIETRNVILDESYIVSHVEARLGEHALMIISDTGLGMDEETQEHLFEPFFTTGERAHGAGGQGTGLGLATVYGIVRQNRGHIEVESELGQGTTFKIYLPKAHTERREALRELAEPTNEPASQQIAESMLQQVPGPEALSPPPRGSETILLVEDEAGVRDLTAHILKVHGYQVLIARDGMHALEIGAQHDGPIHLLLTDVVMPQMNGRELATQLQEKRPGMQVVYMSGYTGETIARHGILEPRVIFMAKPFTMTSLINKVRAVLDSREMGSINVA